MKLFTDKQTDRQTDGRHTHPVAHACYVSVIDVMDGEVLAEGVPGSLAQCPGVADHHQTRPVLVRERGGGERNNIVIVITIIGGWGTGKEQNYTILV